MMDRILAFAGVWIVFAPFLLRYSNESATRISVLTGIVIVTFTLIKIFLKERYSWTYWITFFSGILLMLAPFLGRYSELPEHVYDITHGIIIALISLTGISGAKKIPDEIEFFDE